MFMVINKWLITLWALIKVLTNWYRFKMKSWIVFLSKFYSSVCHKMRNNNNDWYNLCRKMLLWYLCLSLEGGTKKHQELLTIQWCSPKFVKTKNIKKPACLKLNVKVLEMKGRLLMPKMVKLLFIMLMPMKIFWWVTKLYFFKFHARSFNLLQQSNFVWVIYFLYRIHINQWLWKATCIVIYVWYVWCILKLYNF